MKNVVILFLLLLKITFCIGQDKSAYNFDEDISYLNNYDSSNLITWGCGFVGEFVPNNIYAFQKLVEAKRYDLIRNLLSSQVPATKYLAASTLEFAQKRKTITLTKKELQVIKECYKSKEKLSICSGCIGSEVTLGYQLRSGKRNRIKRQTLYWLKTIAK